MTSEIREWLRELAPEPRRTIEVSALLEAAQRRRRRRRLARGLGAVVVSFLVVGVSAGIVVAARDSGSGPRIQTPSGAPPTLAQGNGATLTLPTGWQQLPVTANSSELLLVGTGPGPVAACLPNLPPVSAGAVYVSIATDVLVPPQGQPAPTLPPRPSQFTVAGAGKLDCRTPPVATTPASTPSTTLPPGTATPSTNVATPSTALSSAPTTSTTAPTVTTHVLSFQFSVSGQNLQASVISVDDPGAQLLTPGLAVLNTLEYSSSFGIPHPTGPGPKDSAAAQQAIHDAFIGAFDNAGPVAQAESVQGGYPINANQQQVGRAANPNDIGSIVVRINWLQFVDATHATLNFDLLVNGTTITATTTGQALIENGQWKVARATYCAIIQRGGTIQCPS